MNYFLKAGQMFDGEFASLNAIYETQTIRVPKPIKVDFGFLSFSEKVSSILLSYKSFKDCLVSFF